MVRVPSFRRWFHGPQRSPRRIGLLCLAVGAVWTVFSDRVLALFVQNPSTLTELQTVKGWLCVGRP